jgi:hypothetical protein
MFAANLVEHFTGWAGAAMCYVVQSLPDTVFRIRTLSDIEKMLVGFGVLHDNGSFPFHREHNRALTLAQLLHEIS